jgi:hypothetical protein
MMILSKAPRQGERFMRPAALFGLTLVAACGGSGGNVTVPDAGPGGVGEYTVRHGFVNLERVRVYPGTWAMTNGGSANVIIAGDGFPNG